MEQNVYETHLRNLFASAKKYVIIYAWDADADESMRLSTHVKPRKFTEYISENFKEWRLIGTKEQIYPESSSDFYFYEKSRTACGQIPQSSATYPSAVPEKMHFEAYRNDGWGLSRSAFQQLYGIITASKKSPFRIIEFGSGISTQFLVDCALRNTSKKLKYSASITTPSTYSNQRTIMISLRYFCEIYLNATMSSTITCSQKRNICEN